MKTQPLLGFSRAASPVSAPSDLIMLIIGFASVDCDWQGLQALYKCSLLFQQGGGWERRLHAAAMHACMTVLRGVVQARDMGPSVGPVTVGHCSTHGGLGPYSEKIANSRTKEDIGDESALNR